jgi:hypothetical protein
VSAERWSLAGSVRWAVVPYTPRPPFRIYAGEEHPPFEIATADELVGAAQRPGGEAAFTFLVPAKARPVLILSDPPHEHHREVVALRLLRLSKLEPGEQDVVRAGGDELLLNLPAERFDLPEENAAIVSAIVRLHVDAIASSPPAGTLSAQEVRVLADRLIGYLRLDTQLLVERRLRQLTEALERRRPTE